jgi:hypothetical protein
MSPALRQGLHTLHVPPYFEQFAQYLQFEQARHTPTGLQVAIPGEQQSALALAGQKKTTAPVAMPKAASEARSVFTTRRTGGETGSFAALAALCTSAMKWQT